MRSAEELRREIARLEKLFAENHRKRYATETKNSARFTYAAHMTKLSRKISRLTRELDDAERFESTPTWKEDGND
jgi:hypothetical protein